MILLTGFSLWACDLYLDHVAAVLGLSEGDGGGLGLQLLPRARGHDLSRGALANLKCGVRIETLISLRLKLGVGLYLLLVGTDIQTSSEAFWN